MKSGSTSIYSRRNCWCLFAACLILVVFINYFFIFSSRVSNSSCPSDENNIPHPVLNQLNQAISRLEALDKSERKGETEFGTAMSKLKGVIEYLETGPKNSMVGDVLGKKSTSSLNNHRSSSEKSEMKRGSAGGSSSLYKEKPAARKKDDGYYLKDATELPSKRFESDQYEGRSEVLSREMEKSLYRLNEAVKKLNDVPLHEFREFKKTNFSPFLLKRDVYVVIDMLANSINSQRIFHTRAFQEPSFLQQFPPDLDCRMWFEGALKVQHKWPSQVGQDWINFFNNAAGMEGEKGFFVEVGSRHPRIISNSYFFEKCLGWKGLCIDANPSNVALLRKERDCIVVDKCVSNQTEVLSFYPADFKDSDKRGGGGALTSLTNSKIKTSQRHIDVQCDTLNNILEEYAPGVERINYMTIDIEGAEDRALQGLDLQKYVVDAMAIEFDKTTLNEQYKLEDQGYHKMFTSQMDFIFVRNLVPIYTFMDVMARIFHDKKKDGAYDYIPPKY